MTQRNARNVSSVSQLVKTFNVSKSVCSSNASNSVIFNSTCKPVSSFVRDSFSAKPICKLIDVNLTRPHERLVNNNNSRQHDFTKPFSAVNILIMSICFYELVLIFFLYFIKIFAITMLTVSSKAMSGVIIFLLISL